ncbi:hypothetical protein V6N13_133782 [Hibiscus sabdariffa]
MNTKLLKHMFENFDRINHCKFEPETSNEIVLIVLNVFSERNLAEGSEDVKVLAERCAFHEVVQWRAEHCFQYGGSATWEGPEDQTILAGEALLTVSILSYKSPVFVFGRLECPTMKQVESHRLADASHDCYKVLKGGPKPKEDCCQSPPPSPIHRFLILMRF